MNTSYTIHVTPLIICKDIKVDTPFQSHRCSNEKCRNHTYFSLRHRNEEPSFCSLCGNEIEEFTDFREEYKVSAYEITEATDDKFMDLDKNFLMVEMPKDTQVYMLNSHFEGEYSWEHNDYSDEFINPANIKYEELIEKFKTKFNAEINVFKEAYGKENVSIEWRMFVYAF